MYKHSALLGAFLISGTLFASELTRTAAKENSNPPRASQCLTEAEQQAFIESHSKLFQGIQLGKSWKITMQSTCYSAHKKFVLFENKLQKISPFTQIQTVTLEAHNYPIKQAAFTLDNNYLIAQSTEQLILWDLTDFPNLTHYVLAAGKDKSAVAFCPAAKMCLIMETSSETINKITKEKISYYVLDFNDPKNIKRKPLPYYDNVRYAQAKFSYGGAKLALGLCNGDIALFDLSQPEIRNYPLTKTRHMVAVNSIEFSMDGLTVITSAPETTLDDGEQYIPATFIWNFSGTFPLIPLEFHNKVSFSAPPGELLTGPLVFDYNGQLTLWDIIHLPINAQADLGLVNVSNDFAHSLSDYCFTQPQLYDIYNFAKLSQSASGKNIKNDERLSEILEKLPQQLRTIAEISLRTDNSGLLNSQ